MQIWAELLITYCRLHFWSSTLSTRQTSAAENCASEIVMWLDARCAATLHYKICHGLAISQSACTCLYTAVDHTLSLLSPPSGLGGGSPMHEISYSRVCMGEPSPDPLGGDIYTHPYYIREVQFIVGWAWVSCMHAWSRACETSYM